MYTKLYPYLVEPPLPRRHPFTLISQGKTRLLYRLGLDFWEFTKYVPFIEKFWQSVADQVLSEDLVLIQVLPCHQTLRLGRRELGLPPGGMAEHTGSMRSVPGVQDGEGLPPHSPLPATPYQV